MQKLNYDKLMAHKPTKIHEGYNQRKQAITYYEHPIGGDMDCIIAVFNKQRVAVLTDFFDTEDFYTDSDYNPILLDDGSVVCAFETED